MLPSAVELVARFLKTNGYAETLSALIKEANLPLDIDASPNPQITIEQLLHEKQTFDLSLNFEKLGVEDQERKWLKPAPEKPTILTNLPTRSNILNIALLHLGIPTNPERKLYFVVSTADRHLNLIDPGTPSFAVAHSFSGFQDSPVLDMLVVEDKYLLAACMSGSLILYDTAAEKVLDRVKDHGKYVVKLASWTEGGVSFIASAGWDAKVLLYRLSCGDSDEPCLGKPFAEMTLTTIPETLLFIRSPDNLRPILIVARRDSTFLYYYAVPSPGDITGFKLLGRQNLAPHSNAWVAFTPSDVQLCPADSSLVAVATSSTPHMKLLIVRLLIPPEAALSYNIDTDLEPQQPVTQASQARADLVLQDREEAAIQVNVSTMAPQTAYSTPRLVWRPDGSGVYVSSDDGVVRGFEASTGKLVVALEAHAPGSKLRCLWAGRLEMGMGSDPGGRQQVEYLLSGGFDQRLVLWSVA